ncbi:AfsA-related hotdog domain-containing protein [Nocardiopsis protaetiae]|uniref:AfsA-related hotdog domain-containing protein n=1 Tax=Nocardiopsis protaetiae TaxID=3382270 RepID=UPI00387B6D32
MTHDHHPLCIVGDRFGGFAAHDSVLTLGSFVRAVRGGRFDDTDKPVTLRLGQGIGEYEWDYLHAVLRTYGRDDRFHLPERPPLIVNRAEAHKHRAENVLIADLARVGDDTYRAALRLHSDNEILLDHQTGEHVQGMVVIEAVRQMFLAVTERHHIAHLPPRPYYFVIDSLATDFENFLFPLPAEIHYRTRRADLDDRGRLGFAATVDIEQAGRRAARSEVEFTAFDATFLHGVEHRRAARALAWRPDGRDSGRPERADVRAGV